MENTPTQLSTTAQTVLDSFLDTNNVIDDRRHLYTETKALADALRAAAGCVPKEEWGGENYATGFRDGIAFGCQFLHELAAELERHQDSLYS